MVWFFNLFMKNSILKQGKRSPNRKSRWSTFNAWLHLWLGLSSGIIVFVVSITGALFVFCDPIIDALAYDSLYVNEIKDTRLTPEELISAFKKENPDRIPSYYIMYRDPTRSVKMGSYTKERNLQFTWMDPYTGKTLTNGSAYNFFYIVAHIHSGEMPFGKAGGLIVEIAVWIFLIELLTGIILWWPKKWNKTTKKQSFSIKTNASFKRLNYDLHNVPGFYSLLPALMITVTGLIVVNKPLNNITHKILDRTSKPFTKIRKLSPEYNPTKTFSPLTPVVTALFEKNASVEQVKLSVPKKDSITTLFAVAAKDIGLKGIENGKTYLINRYTGKEVEIPMQLMNGLAIDNMNMNLHIGFWVGWLGKTLTFIVGIVCSCLPVTGFLIWYGRRNKKKSIA